MTNPLGEIIVDNQTQTGSISPSRSTASVQARAATFWNFLLGNERSLALERYGTLAARILISQIFLISGIMKILGPSETAAQMESRGMFWVPLFLVGAIVCELGGGLSLLLGYKTRLGAIVLFLFLIPVTLTFHNFWTYPPSEQLEQMIKFTHNLTLLGGLVLVMIVGPGPLSIDLRQRRS